METQISAYSAELVLLPENISQNTLDSCDTFSMSMNKGSLPMQMNEDFPECYGRLPENITPTQTVKTNEFDNFKCVNTSQQHISSKNCHYIELDNHSPHFEMLSNATEENMLEPYFEDIKIDIPEANAPIVGVNLKEDFEEVDEFKKNVQSWGNESFDRNFMEVKQFACHICQTTCSTEVSFQYHMKLHNPIHAIKVANSEGNIVKSNKQVCPICNKKIHHLKRHMLTHTGEKPFQCNICQKCYTSNVMLNYHIKSHTGEKPFCCTECDYSAKTKRRLQQHYNRKHTVKVPNSDGNNVNTKKTICPICDKRIFNLKCHMLVHTGEKPFECYICHNRYATKNSLEYHIKSHTGEKPFKRIKPKKQVCPICNKRILQLKRHMLTHTGEKPFECNICHNRYTSKHWLEYHIKSHTGEESFKRIKPKKQVCPSCNKRVLQLNRHMLTHTGEKSFQCHICQKCYKSKTALSYHMKLHTGEKPFPCTQCDYLGMTKIHLRQHCKRRHKKTIICRICNKIILDLNLKDHMSSHTGEKPSEKDTLEHTKMNIPEANDPIVNLKEDFEEVDEFKKNVQSWENESSFCSFDRKFMEAKQFTCHICQATYTTKATFQYHMRLHNRIHVIKVSNSKGNIVKPKKKVCPVCNTKVLRLKRHMLTHTGEKRLQCNICQHRYTTKDLLDKHIKWHTEEKPCRCTECDYSGKTKKHLRQHYDRMHTKLIRSCPICNKKVLNLKSHLLIHSHRHKTRFECNICHNRYKTKRLLKFHLTSHTGEKRFCCTECDYTGKTQRYLQRHCDRMHTDKVKRAKTSNSSPPHVVNQNVKSHSENANNDQHNVSEEQALEPHLQNIRSNIFEAIDPTSEFPFNILRSTSEQDAHESHFQRVEIEIPEATDATPERHPTTLNSACEENICEPPHLHNVSEATNPTSEPHFDVLNNTSEENILEPQFQNNHIESHTEEIPFCCPQCDYSAKTNKQVQKHYNRMHAIKTVVNTKKTIICGICNKKVIDSNLKCHMSVHAGEKPFECNICHNLFTHKPSLKRHIQSHTGEKLFLCTECDYSTKTEACLRQHYNRMHTVQVAKLGTTKTVCPICNKRIFNLKRHMFTHTNEKLFECYFCNNRYKNKESFERHLKLHESFKCTECNYLARDNDTLQNHCKNYHAVFIIEEGILEQALSDNVQSKILETVTPTIAVNQNLKCNSEIANNDQHNVSEEQALEPHVQNIRSNIFEARDPTSKPHLQNVKSNILEAVGPTVAVNFKWNPEEPKHIQNSINEEVEVKDKDIKINEITHLKEWPENLQIIKSEEIQIKDELICEGNPVFTAVDEYVHSEPRFETSSDDFEEDMYERRLRNLTSNIFEAAHKVNCKQHFEKPEHL